jgi:hypothetical protein
VSESSSRLFYGEVIQMLFERQKDKDKKKQRELMRLAIESKTLEDKERLRAERQAISTPTTDGADWVLVCASLKAVGSALTPVGVITGWGQGDLKKLNAERKGKGE